MNCTAPRSYPRAKARPNGPTNLFLKNIVDVRYGRAQSLPANARPCARQAGPQRFFIYALSMLIAQLEPLLSAYDSGYSFQHAQTRPQPVFGLVGACADRVQPRMGMRGPAGPRGVRHCGVVGDADGESNLRIGLIIQSFASET